MGRFLRSLSNIVQQRFTPGAVRMSSIENDPLNFSIPSEVKSLAQAVRSRELKQARGILFIVGVLTMIGNGVFMAKAKDAVDKEIDKQIADVGSKGLQVDPQ